MLRPFTSRPGSAAPAADASKPTARALNRRAFGDITNAGAVMNNGANKPQAAFNAAAPVAESRPYMDRGVDDIDARDGSNPLLASQCVNPMYEYFMESEKIFQVNPEYLQNNTLINDKMRCILVDWLVRLCNYTCLYMRI